jgi:protein TonB
LVQSIIFETQATPTSVTCPGYSGCLVWSSMPLRCLLFSSTEDLVQPIWQVLADLGIEGEYCQTAMDAVEKVTTQAFQIVITDWDDQPEAGFLLKTARELKASQRPLTLAIVSDDARLPEALQAGANSVLVKPIRTEQVRDTMSTACELLRAKQQPAAPQPALLAQREASQPVAMAAAAASGGVSAPASLPSSVSQPPENAFRAGEFLQSSSSAPGAQFDTENEVHKSLEQVAAAEVDALTELEPMAAAVEDSAAPEPEVQAPLTGWASLQARLMKVAPPPQEDAPAEGVLRSYGDTASQVRAAARTVAEERQAPEHQPREHQAREHQAPAKPERQPESGPEAALFAYISGEAEESAPPAQESRTKLGRLFLLGVLAAGVVLIAVPRTRQSLRIIYASAMRAGARWLNPPPAAIPQAVPQHDSFGQSGDEYNIPVPANIPDATTDPSQIRVLPVVDPTAKPQKGSEANGAQAAAGDSNPTDQNQTSQGQPVQNQSNQNQPSQNQPGQDSSGQAPVGENQVPVKDPASANTGGAPGNAADAASVPAPAPISTPTSAPTPAATAAPQQPTAPAPQAAPAQRPVTPPAQNSAPQPAASGGGNAGIPSSLKSQIASMTPEASGTKPPEAAMTSIEPVNLPEAEAWGLLAQSFEPVYPDAAKAGGQKGSVVLQVLIGRDGAVQDAKFLQGSLVFARAAIDAVKQWRFKPYSMNGRAVSVQSAITLNFKPPA